eukprot:4441345-Pyramimonas_sp.AAC.1
MTSRSPETEPVRVITELPSTLVEEPPPAHIQTHPWQLSDTNLKHNSPTGTRRCLRTPSTTNNIALNSDAISDACKAHLVRHETSRVAVLHGEGPARVVSVPRGGQGRTNDRDNRRSLSLCCCRRGPC